MIKLSKNIYLVKTTKRNGSDRIDYYTSNKKAKNAVKFFGILGVRLRVINASRSYCSYIVDNGQELLKDHSLIKITKELLF